MQRLGVIETAQTMRGLLAHRLPPGFAVCFAFDLMQSRMGTDYLQRVGGIERQQTMQGQQLTTSRAGIATASTGFLHARADSDTINQTRMVSLAANEL